MKTLRFSAAVMSSVDIGIQVDAALLFQRMMTVATVGVMNLQDVMCYELYAS